MTRKVVVVTGASAGVGRATVRRFAEPGTAIGLLARGQDGLEGARQEVESAGGEALIVPTDMADAEAVEQAAQEIEDAFGTIDIWINNAMATVFSPIREMLPEEFKRVTDVTYLGYVYGTLAALKRMLPRDRGRIIQVGSALAYRSIPLQSAYCAAKRAVQGFTESLHTELYHDGSRVQLTMLQMPALNTPQFDWSKSRMPRKAQPVPPIFQPEVAAEAIHWAAHHDRPEWFVGWSTVQAILGEKVMPHFLDHYLASTGYESQMTDEPEDPNRPHNLWQPVGGDHGAHGRFDHRSQNESRQWWVTTHRGTAALGVGAALLAGLWALKKSA